MRRVIVAAALLALSVVHPRQALAHSTLVTTDPVDGSVVTSVPAIRLVFDEEVSSARIVLRGATGSVTPVRIDRGGDAAIVIARPGRVLPKGAYRVTWRVRSADGHWISRSLAFTIRR